MFLHEREAAPLCPLLAITTLQMSGKCDFMLINA